MYCASALYLKSSNCYSINDDDDDDHTCVVQFKPKKKTDLDGSIFFSCIWLETFSFKINRKKFFCVRCYNNNNG